MIKALDAGAGAVVTEQGEDLAAMHRETEVIHGWSATSAEETPAEALHQALNAQDGVPWRISVQVTSGGGQGPAPG